MAIFFLSQHQVAVAHGVRLTYQALQGQLSNKNEAEATLFSRVGTCCRPAPQGSMLAYPVSFASCFR